MTGTGNRWSLSNFGLRGLIVIVAGLATVLAAWRYYQENMNADRAMFTLWRRQLDDADPAVRLRGAQALSDVRGEETRRAVTALVGRLNDPDARVREASAWTLGLLFGRWNTRAELDPDVPEASEAVIRLFDDDAPNVRAAAVRALMPMVLPRPRPAIAGGIPAPAGPPAPQVGPDPTRAVPALKARLLDDDIQVRDAALMALAGLIPDEAEARRLLMEVFDGEPTPRLRASVLRLFDWTGAAWRNDPEVVRLFVRALGDPDREVRSTASWLLTNNGLVLPPDARAELAERVRESGEEEQTEDADRDLNRQMLARSLIRTSDDPDAIRPLLRDRDPIIRSMARGALGLADDDDGEDEAGGRP